MELVAILKALDNMRKKKLKRGEAGKANSV